jgi:DNA-binding transcriptional LysR family regulator
MQLRHIRSFLAVAEELHFTRAAARLGMSQPPLTQQIKALEEEVGAKLFDRRPAGTQLTDAGKIFLAEVRPILAKLNIATSLARRAAEGVIGNVGIGFIEVATFHPLISGVLREFRARYPTIEMRLEENYSSSLIEALLENRLQVLFVRPPSRPPQELAVHELVNEPRVLAVSKAHPMAARRQVAIAQFKDETFITHPMGGAEAIFGDQFTPRISQLTPGFSSTINLVAAGLGVAVVPASMRHVRTDSVNYVKISDPLPRARIALIHQRKEASKAVGNFIALALRHRAKKTPEASGT